MALSHWLASEGDKIEKIIDVPGKTIKEYYLL
jgi:hypothetical protein